jgi:hypothetical protein
MVLASMAALSTGVARAQTYAYYQEPPPALRQHAARLMFGGAAVSRGVYCAYGYYATSCSNIQYQFAPLNFTGELELGRGPFGFALGVHYLTGSWYDHNVNIWEPSGDLVFRLGSYNAGSSFRFRLGAGYWSGQSSRGGWTGRTGIGLTLRGKSPFGLAMDLIWEYGSFEGHSASVVQYVIGGEMAF